ncbi:MAG: TonB-dependent receptor [Halieaceae bacterium]
MKLRYPFSRTLLATAVTLTLPSFAAAQQLEEVLVTATKRVESTQDIPMSVQAITGETLNNMGIDNLSDMASTVPNFTVGDSLTVSSITMRGIGSGEDRGFETPVATFKDGIYMPRNRQTRSPFFDVDRVEVLRGPQAVLFGLNSTAGAISIHGATNNPGDEFELTLTGEYEAEYSGYMIRGVAGGSLGDSLGWRLALETKDSGDGWLDNPIAGDSGESEHDIARLSLVWEPTDNLVAKFRWEHNDASQEGQTTELVNGELNLPGDFDAGAPGGFDARVAQWNAIAGGAGLPLYDTGGENNKFDYKGFHAQDLFMRELYDPIQGGGNYRDKLGADQEIDNISLSLDWALGEYTLTGLFGYSDYEYDAAVNIGGTAESIYFGTNYEEYDQTSAELRIASPIGNTIEWIAGVYYHDATLYTDQPNTIDVGKFFGIFLGLPEAVVLDAFGLPPVYELLGADFEQDTELLSPFVSMTWNISDAVRVTGGVRYSDEEKDYDRRGSTPNSSVYLKNPDGSIGPALGFSVINATGAAVGSTSGTVSSDNTMPELMVEWDITDDIMLFARYAESAKAGGVATSGSVSADGLIYDDETAESFEIGMKGLFLDGSAELNVVAFSTTYEDLQVKTSQVSTGGIVTNIGNAGEATSEGIEIDGRMAVTDWLLFGGNVAWLDAEYDKYDNADCNRSQSTKVSASGVGCDLKGESLPFAADYSGSVYADLTFPMGASMNFIANLTVAFSDGYTTQGSLEPTLEQDSWTRLSGRVGVAASDDKWSLTVIGQNLTEEEVWVGGQPLFGNDLVYPTMPRTVSLQGVYRF